MPVGQKGFAKSNTIARDSNNQARKRVRKSKSRKTLDKLQELSPKALEKIEDSVNGKEVDSACLSTAKWIINTIGTVSKSIAQEEDLLNGTRWKADDLTREEEEAEKEQESRPTFSLHCLPTPSDLK